MNIIRNTDQINHGPEQPMISPNINVRVNPNLPGSIIANNLQNRMLASPN